MEQVGRIVKVKNKRAEVRIQRTSACGGDCGKCSGCAPTNVLVSAKNDMNAQVGQLVVLDLNTKNILAAAFMIYIVPIMAFIIGYIVTYSYSVTSNLSINPQIAAMFIGVCSFIISFLVIRIVDKRLQQSKRLELRITKIMH